MTIDCRSSGETRGPRTITTSTFRINTCYARATIVHDRGGAKIFSELSRILEYQSCQPKNLANNDVARGTGWEEARLRRKKEMENWKRAERRGGRGELFAEAVIANEAGPSKRPR